MILNKNNNIKKKIIIPFSILSITTLLSLIGKSSYVLPGNEIDLTIKEDKDVKPVCYIQGKKDVKYTSIEKALSVAGDKDHINTSETIVVIPGTNPIISSSCTLYDKDTLLIPYEDETYMRDISNITENNVSTVSSINFSDNDSTSVDNNKKNEVTIKSYQTGKQIVFENNGNIKIGGELGVGDENQRPTGHTNGKYSQITIGDDAIIENNGSIDIYGYIKKENINGTGKIKSNSSSSITMPLVIDDFKGGSYSSACNSQKVFPFNVFELVNCQCMTEYYVGAELYVMTAIYASGKIYVPDNSKLISKTGALFNLSSGKVILNYSSYSFPYTKVDNIENQDSSKISRMNIGLDGTLSFDSMSLSLGGISLETGDFTVPLSYKFSVSCLKGSKITIKKPTKFLSGSSVFVEEGAMLIFDSPSIFYQNYVDQSVYVAGKYPKKLGAASFINDGNLVINSNFAGKILTNDSSGSITTGTSFSPIYTTNEMINVKSGGVSWTYREIKGIAYGDIKNSDNEVTSEKKFLNNNNYKANNGSWIGYGNSIDEYETIGSDKSGSCILLYSLILMSNGTYKKAIDIRANDLVMSINHETGKIEPTSIVFNDDIDKESSYYDVLSLEFSNDKTVEIVYEHGFFDLDTNKYEYITLDNYQSFIGHRFVSVDYINGKFIKGIATLNKGYITNKFTRICSPVTYKNLNIITENMLSMPGGISGLFNIFEYDKNLAYDQVKKNEDINKYGLLGYSYFNNLIPYEVYEAFNGKYLKVAMGKGILTKKQLNNYIERYLPIISKQNNCH